MLCADDFAVLQVLGIYFLVAGAADLTEWGTLLVEVSMDWPSAVGHLGEAAVRLAAGLLLVARPTAVAQRVAALP
jgi:hypothetical protein